MAEFTCTLTLTSNGVTKKFTEKDVIDITLMDGEEQLRIDQTGKFRTVKPD